MLYPEWLPGYHAPEAPLEFLAGLRFASGGKPIAWRRDPVQMHAFHLELPQGITALEIAFQLLCPTAPEQGRVGLTRELLNLQWNAVLLYPAGYPSRRIGVRARLDLPDDWEFACTLPVREQAGATTQFALAPLDMAVDSPLFAGRHCRRYELGSHITLNVFGDRASQTEVGEAPLSLARNLVAEADKLFGARHFDRYDFLVAVSHELGELGVEHHRSAEIVFPPDFFTDWNGTRSRNDILAHEYVHSWNGKFRRGADSCTSTFDQPLQNSLMWVYEGLTQYWGQVLAARSGLWSAQTAREALARIAARCCNMKGRSWRPLRDTTRDPIIRARKQLPWESWQRNADYYTDGQLIWLDADTLLRERSGEERSLDDFADEFFGMQDGSFDVLPYDFDDVVKALGDICPFDWGGYFAGWLAGCDLPAPLDGISRGGYELVFRDTPTPFHRAGDELNGLLDLTFSLGLSVSSEGKVKEVIWESPAFHAGVTAGVEIVAVNGRSFSTAEMEAAVAADRGAVRLVVRKLNHCEELEIAYRGGHRFPHLVRREGEVPRLDAIMAPRR